MLKELRPILWTLVLHFLTHIFMWSHHHLRQEKVLVGVRCFNISWICIYVVFKFCIFVGHLAYQVSFELLIDCLTPVFIDKLRHLFARQDRSMKAHLKQCLFGRFISAIQFCISGGLFIVSLNLIMGFSVQQHFLAFVTTLTNLNLF